MLKSEKPKAPPTAASLYINQQLVIHKAGVLEETKDIKTLKGAKAVL